MKIPDFIPDKWDSDFDAIGALNMQRLSTFTDLDGRELTERQHAIPDRTASKCVTKFSLCMEVSH